MPNGEINQEKLDDILKRRLVQTPDDARGNFPVAVFSEGGSYITILTDSYFVLAFVDETEKQRLDEMRRRGLHPFPALISVEPMPSAFKFEGAKNSLLVGNRVENMISFSLGGDSTIIVRDHYQSINTPDLGNYSYVVQCAYIISFGEEIDQTNMYGYLDDLIAYSVMKWSQDDGT